MKKILSVLLLFFLLLVTLSVMAEEPMWLESQTYFETASGGLSTKEALQGYIDRVFGVDTGIVPKAAPRGSLLTGKEAKLYTYLVTEIKKIASGERTSSEIRIPLIQLLDQLSFTADDLNVGAITLNGTISAEAKASFSEKTAINTDAVHAALLADLPYDLYWYNKTSGGGISYGADSYFYYNDSRIYYKDDATYKVSFAVANEFIADGAADMYTINASLLAAIQNSAQNARAIVMENSNKSDIEKLKTYKEAICNRVDYNYAAADDDTTPYGNPWQLVWVFDDDPETKVVCEGYSKAFKYLCDLSEFKTNLTVSLMSGVMEGGTGAGNHMWNLVAMGNSRNYLVDVTNCDGNSIGAPDLLFMKGYSYISPDERTYGYDVGHGTMVYYNYDSDTLTLYSAAELAASGQAFDPASYPAANLYGYTLTIPEDTVYIDSQAFADLGEPVNILIRQSDITIADDAFLNSTVILIGPDSLREWAEGQQIPFVSLTDLPDGM